MHRYLTFWWAVGCLMMLGAAAHAASCPFGVPLKIPASEIPGTHITDYEEIQALPWSTPRKFVTHVVARTRNGAVLFLGFNANCLIAVERVPRAVWVASYGEDA